MEHTLRVDLFSNFQMCDYSCVTFWQGTSHLVWPVDHWWHSIRSMSSNPNFHLSILWVLHKKITWVLESQPIPLVPYQKRYGIFFENRPTFFAPPKLGSFLRGFDGRTSNKELFETAAKKLVRKLLAGELNRKWEISEDQQGLLMLQKSHSQPPFGM